MSQNGRPTMTPHDFDAIRKKLGFSMDGFAIELGYEGTPQGNRETMKRFLHGKRPIPLPIAKLAWLMSRTGIPTWPQELTAAPAKGDGT